LGTVNKRLELAPICRFDNDLFKDDRGLLWVTDKERGLDVIEYKN
jgi:hypothetical protein